MPHRILTAEDSLTQGYLLQGYLEDAGFEVVLAHDGVEALRHLETTSFDLVVSDIVMPGVDGYELCRRVKERDDDLPVVLLTSLTDPLEIVRGLEVGADNFLHKPYEPDHLISRVRSLLEHKELRAAGHAHMFMQVTLRDRTFKITAERQQILDLIVSSFDDFVTMHEALGAAEEALSVAHTTLNRATETAERQQLLLQAMADAAGHAMFVVDHDGNVTDANSRLLALLGCDRQRVIGWPVQEAVLLFLASGEVVPTRMRPLLRVLGGGIDHVALGHDTMLFVEAVSGLLPVTLEATAVRDSSGQIIAAIGVLREAPPAEG